MRLEAGVVRQLLVLTQARMGQAGLIYRSQVRRGVTRAREAEIVSMIAAQLAGLSIEGVEPAMAVAICRRAMALLYERPNDSLTDLFSEAEGIESGLSIQRTLDQAFGPPVGRRTDP